jgi:hypothetical protein
VGGIQATVVTDEWMNDVQENLMAVLVAGNVSPTKGRAADLLDAIMSSTTGRLMGAPKVFLASGTYTPSPGMKYCIAEYQGGAGLERA